MNKKCTLILLFLFAGLVICHAQQPFLTIASSYVEKSKDSHSTTETFIITGNSLLYTVKYTGRREPGQTDQQKHCTLAGEQVKAIRETIQEKRLDVTDSMVVNLISERSLYVTAHISIMVNNGQHISNTKLKGNPVALQGKPLYKNAMALLNQVREMLDNCSK